MISAPLNTTSIEAPSDERGAAAHSAARSVFDLICVMGVNAFLLWFFYNRFWYSTDEGNYAHVAQRLLNGEILNLQIQDIHPGYIHFVNAAALGLFGSDLISLRYPLVLISFAQAFLIFVLFSKSGRHKSAVAASIAMTALGVIQFLNPTTNWYCLFLVVVIACCLDWLPRETSLRLFVVGFLLVTLTLFRQLSGILVAIGVLAYLLIEARDGDQSRSVAFERGVIALMAVGLTCYLFKATDIVGAVLFGFCPLAILIWLWVNATTGARQVLRIMTPLSAGGTIAALPLVLYHLFNRSLGSWLNDTVFSAVGLIKLEFMEQRFFGKVAFFGVYQVFHAGKVGEILNGFYWFLLPLVALFNGIVVLRFLGRTRKLKQTGYALPILAVFYGIVSVHFQIPIYLYYTVGLSLVGLLWMIPPESRLRYLMIPAVLLLSGIGVYYHAAQPLSGKMSDILRGNRTIASLSNDNSSLARTSLKIEIDDRLRYAELLQLIEREAEPDDTIFALPSSAELYFLSGRRNPFRFYNSALGIRSEGELQQVRETIINHPPKLVVYKPDDKYNTSYSREIISLVKDHYIFLGETSGFEIYRARQESDKGNHVRKSYGDTPSS